MKKWIFAFVPMIFACGSPALHDEYATHDAQVVFNITSDAYTAPKHIDEKLQIMFTLDEPTFEQTGPEVTHADQVITFENFRNGLSVNLRCSKMEGQDEECRGFSDETLDVGGCKVNHMFGVTLVHSFPRRLLLIDNYLLVDKRDPACTMDKLNITRGVSYQAGRR